MEDRGGERAAAGGLAVALLEGQRRISALAGLNLDAKVLPRCANTYCL